MARRLIGMILGSAAATALTASVSGCATASRSAALPKPTFTGPVVARPAYVPPAPVVIAKAATPAPVRTIRPANVPAAWVPLATAQKRNWTWIVIHHSATPTGSMAEFDKAHKAKGWDGVGYHFVIGNGTGTADGQIEVTPRWPTQKHGAHAKTPDNQFNEHGIGICMVGNMDNRPPTAKQLASMEKLIAYLADTYNVKQSNILGHKMTGKSTDCPGSMTNIAMIRADVAKLRRTALVDGNIAGEPIAAANGDELIQAGTP